MADFKSDKHSSETGFEVRNAVTYPILLTGSCCRVLVVGGGKVATRKIRGLLAAGMEVEVISPDTTDELHEHIEAGDVHWHDCDYSAEAIDVAQFCLVFAATNVRAVNAIVAADARDAKVLVNVADDPASCDFFTPAVLRNETDGVIVAVSSTTGEPIKARDWKDRIKGLLGR